MIEDDIKEQEQNPREAFLRLDMIRNIGVNHMKNHTINETLYSQYPGSDTASHTGKF